MARVQISVMYLEFYCSMANSVLLGGPATFYSEKSHLSLFRAGGEDGGSRFL
jgi:hypothetical protein